VNWPDRPVSRRQQHPKPPPSDERGSDRLEAPVGAFRVELVELEVMSAAERHQRLVLNEFHRIVEP
jgi:hypothetical protein